MKKIIPVIVTSLLFLFSFYYTKKLVEIIKTSDPIMRMIKDSKDYYKVSFVNGVISDDETIKLGLNGIIVNDDKSYNNMKRYGTYNSSLLVYDEIKPDITIKDHIDKYVIGSIAKTKNISLLIKVKDINIVNKVLSVLEEKDIKVTFIFNNEDILNNKSLMKKISTSHNISATDYDDLIYFELITLNKSNLPFCFVEYKNDDVKRTCQDNNMYTVLPTIIAKTKVFSTIKNNIRGEKL